MITLEAKHLLANLLVYRDVVTIPELKATAKQLSDDLPDIYVDITKNAIISALNSFPLLFKEHRGSIVRAHGVFETRYIDLFFNDEFPDFVKNALHAIR